MINTLTRLLPNSQEGTLDLINRIEIHAKHVDVFLPLKLVGKIRESHHAGEKAAPDLAEPGQMRLTLPWRMQTRGGKTDILAGDRNTPQPDPSLIRALRSAQAMLERGPKNRPVLQSAPTSPWRRNLVRLAFLAPDIQHIILNGRQPDPLTLALLMKDEIPLMWSD
ncbi:hypothetical protein J0X12_05145 [Sneathiella sp. CAU 1612]|uniref:Uncharacterized protein n=1 Tax=Sneathiella sedimenti TaxID=2816034 RepID=A0ABS3F3A1_9PROT|nr:hypothetical protein [Sneathiella sedimenti]MBO0332986.1 hypothetical protein [Sneathiella sedimenti]